VGKHLKDELFVHNLISIFQCGFIYKNKDYICYNVYKFKDIYYKIIPFFYKCKIEREKFSDFKYFCEAAELINNKAHLTLDGFNKINDIKSRMNKARY
jgi:hypothetical protein